MATDTQQTFSNNRNQYISGVVANLIFMCHGSMLGWFAPVTNYLMSDETPLETGPLTNEQLSWIGSINAFGGILSSLAFGFITLRFGCKRTMLFLTLPSALFFVLIYIGDTFYHILAARFFIGFCGGGIKSTIILYIAEIANNDIRGRLSTFSNLSRNSGVLMAYIIGAVVQYHVVPCIFIFIPIIFGICFGLLPNTPQYHLGNGDLNKAEKSLKFYKGIKGDNDVDYRLFLAEFERLKLISNEQKVEEKLRLKDFLNRAALLGITAGVILSGLALLSGSLIFVTYAVLIFEKVGVSNIDPYVSSVSLAVFQLIGNLCTTSFSDSLGRKALLIISLLGSAFGMFVFALYSYSKERGFDLSSFGWVPVVSLSFVIFISSAGVIPLMFLSMVEHIPSKIRTVGIMICNVCFYLVHFTTLKLFPILMESIGLHGCLLIMAISCSLGCVYVVFVIKETKGISLDTQKIETTHL